jgi:hypothetical protein
VWGRDPTYKRKILMLKKSIIGTVILLGFSCVALGACSLLPRQPHKMQIQVKCPPETGNQTFNIPEILQVRS